MTPDGYVPLLARRSQKIMMPGNRFIERVAVVPGILALLFIVLCNVLILVSVREQMIFLTREDGLVEYAAVIFYLGAALIMFSLYKRSAADSLKKRYLLGRRQNFGFLILGLVFVFFAGEEISWGQRILNFDTPGSLARLNRQEEMTLHNLNFWEALDLDGSEKQGIKRLYSSVALYTYFWFTLFIVISSVSKLWPGTKRFFKLSGIPVVNLFYGFLFLTNFVVYELLESTNLELRPLGELKETNFALLYLAVSVSIKIQNRQSEGYNSQKSMNR